MSRDGYKGPKLPRVLLDKVQSGEISKNKRNESRKDRRKAERQAKRQSHRPQQPRHAADNNPRSQVHAREQSSSREVEVSFSSAPVRTQPDKDAKPLKSVLKKRAPTPESESQEDGQDTDGTEASSEGEGGGAQDQTDLSELVVSRPSKRKLDEDDAEIAALEKKLGIKGKRSKALQDDGLDWLAGGSDEDNDVDVQRPEDLDWLKSKRRQANTKAQEASSEESEIGDEAASDENTDGEDDFADFGSEAEQLSDDDTPRAAAVTKENPYVAPGTTYGTSSPAAKYVPPSLRKVASSDEEMLRQLHRQVQGKVNKVSESNLVSILREVEDIYKDNARQHVSSTLIEIFISLVAADVAHPDTVLITNAAFAAAVYKVIGTDFGAKLLERVVERFNHFNGQGVGERKQPLNLMAFLSYLYNLQVVGCGLLFDYIRLLLQELTEDNTEMLLRIMRISGQQLRQDDPSALKDIVMLLQKLVAKTGEDNLSVRTKFMIETINNLKNNRVKTGLAASSIAAEQISRMKKTLGTLNPRAKATEPLRITLADINDTSKKGKWWLVGASFHDPAKLASNINSSTTTPHDDSDTGYESSTPGSVNLTKLAKKQGMNTDVRRAIFISLLSAADYKDAHIRLMKLHLKNKQQLEIPRVLVTCVGGEEAYNPYYALVARRFCASGREIRKAFQFVLWAFWRELEKEGDGSGDAEIVGVRKVVNLAKFYANLVADGSLSLAVLKKLDFAVLPAKGNMFAEVLLASVLFQLSKGRQNGGATEGNGDVVFGDRVRKVFTVAGAPEMVFGLQYFIRQTVEGSELARTKKEKKALSAGCQIALEALADAERSAPLMNDDVESEGDSEG